MDCVVVDVPLAGRHVTAIHATHPVRTCVGCRGRDDKANLMRLVAVDDTCVIDVLAQLPGRGAYLHPTSECLELAVRRRAFSRALRVQNSLDAESVQRHFHQADLSTDHSGAVE